MESESLLGDYITPKVLRSSTINQPPFKGIMYHQKCLVVTISRLTLDRCAGVAVLDVDFLLPTDIVEKSCGIAYHIFLIFSGSTGAGLCSTWHLICSPRSAELGASPAGPSRLPLFNSCFHGRKEDSVREHTVISYNCRILADNPQPPFTLPVLIRAP